MGPYISNSALLYIDIAKSNSNIMYALDRNDLYKSTNGGNSWQLINEPALGDYPVYYWIEIDPTNANHLWVTSYYGIYESFNGGTSWADVTGSLPKVSINTVVYDEGSNGELYVGTDLGVFYKDNTMSDWQEYGNGLPNVEIRELDILENGNILRAGTYGRGMWEVPIGGSPSGAPNLTCYNPGTLSISGNTITISNHKVINNGSVTSIAATIGYYLSTDASITSSDYLIGAASLSSLAKNNIANMSFSGTIPSSLPAGTYYVGILIDKDGIVTESNEVDNSCYYSSPKVTVSSVVYDCQNIIVYANGTIPHNSKFVASDKVISQGILYSGRNSYTRAQNNIEFNAGFEVKAGGILSAEIRGCGGLGGTNVLVQNSNHVITYSEAGQNIKFTIDVIRNETNHLKGTYPNVDFFRIDVDRNRNGIIDSYSDLGYSTSSNSTAICNYYNISCTNGSSTTCGYFNTGAFFESKFSGTSYSNTPHVSFEVTVPKAELCTSNIAHIKLRIYERGMGSTVYPTNNTGCFSSILQLSW